MKPKADWLAWSLQYLAGLAAVGMLSLTSRRRQDSFWDLLNLGAPSGTFPPGLFFLGVALLAAGLASYYGQRFWFGPFGRIHPHEGIGHSPTSRLLSRITGAAGIALILLAIGRRFVGF